MDEEQGESTLSLVEIIKLRGLSYRTFTEQALLPFEQKLNAAVSQYLNNDLPIKWVDVDRLLGLDAFVLVVGYIFPLVGTIVIVDNKPITITEENVSNYRQTLRFVLPIRLLEVASIVQLHKFIIEISALAAVLSEAELTEMLHGFKFDDESFSFDESYAKMLAYATRPAEMFGFNTKQLSEDQITSLSMFGGAILETKN